MKKDENKKVNVFYIFLLTYILVPLLFLSFSSVFMGDKSIAFIFSFSFASLAILVELLDREEYIFYHKDYNFKLRNF